MVNPTGYTALDLVGFTDKGPYAPNVNYVRNDLSHDSGNIWRCLIDDTIGIRPTEGANWTIFISEPSNMVETSIAPIETSPATAAHTVGTQLYYNDTLYKVKAAIAVGDSLVVDTNIELADNITTQLAAKANTSDLGTAAAKDSTSTIAQGSTDLIESGAVYSALGDKANTADLGTAAAKDSIDAVTQSSTDLVESGAVYSELSSVKQALSDEVEVRSTLGAYNLFDDNGLQAGDVAGAGATIRVSTKIAEHYYVKAGDKLIIRRTQNYTNNLKYAVVVTDADGSVVGYIISSLVILPYNEDVEITSTYEGYIRFVFAKYNTSESLTTDEIRNNKIVLRLPKNPFIGYLPYVPTNAELLSADANAELGAHNFAESEVYGFGFASAAVGAETTITSASTTCFIAKLKQNTNYVFSEVGGNRATLALSVNLPAIGGTVKVISNPGEVSGSYSASFNSGSYNYVIMYCNSTVTTYDAVKPLLKLASDPSTKFTPYAMTNRELTEKVIVESFDSVVTPTESRITISSQKLYKQGNICTLVINFTSNINDANALLGRISIIPKDGNKFIGYCVDTSDKSTHLVYVSSAYGYFGGYGVLTSGHTFEASITYISEN